MRFSRQQHRLAATLLLVATVVPGIALANYHAPMWLKGTEEVPANGTTGVGIGTLDIINGVVDSVRVNITFSGLSSNANAAHIHGPAALGANAGVIIPLTVPAATSGTIAQSVPLTAQQRTWMVNNLTYVNIHTVNNGGGEIRGQVDSLQLSPANSKAPGASGGGLALLGVAMAGLAAAVLIRRRKAMA